MRPVPSAAGASLVKVDENRCEYFVFALGGDDEEDLAKEVDALGGGVVAEPGRYKANEPEDDAFYVGGGVGAGPVHYSEEVEDVDAFRVGEGVVAAPVQYREENVACLFCGSLEPKWQRRRRAGAE